MNSRERRRKRRGALNSRAGTLFNGIMVNSVVNPGGNVDFGSTNKRPLPATAAEVSPSNPQKKVMLNGPSLLSTVANSPGVPTSVPTSMPASKPAPAPVSAPLATPALTAAKKQTPASEIAPSFSPAIQPPTEKQTICPSNETVKETTSVASTETEDGTEETQLDETENDLRTYVQMIDMFDLVVSKLWARGQARKNATQQTEKQWLLASLEKDLMKRMAARLNNLVDKL